MINLNEKDQCMKLHIARERAINWVKITLEIQIDRDKKVIKKITQS